MSKIIDELKEKSGLELLPFEWRVLENIIKGQNLIHVSGCDDTIHVSMSDLEEQFYPELTIKSRFPNSTLKGLENVFYSEIDTSPYEIMHSVWSTTLNAAIETLVSCKLLSIQYEGNEIVYQLNC